MPVEEGCVMKYWWIAGVFAARLRQRRAGLETAQESDGPALPQGERRWTVAALNFAARLAITALAPYVA